MSATLGTTAFWILTSLTGGRRHGYAILLDVDEASGDPGSLKTTTLYATIERLQARGLVSEDGDEIVDGRARRYYVLTDTGRTRLEQEIADLERRASAARRALASPKPVPATTPAVGMATFA
jgi:DNA-binding PadR family transcriptional regulator